MSDQRVIKNMRHMAWDRAKGELNSILNTYWDEDCRYEEMKEAIKEFVSLVEDTGLID